MTDHAAIADGWPGQADGSAILRTEALTRHFRIGSTMSRATLHAVDDVSISIGERQIVALAGESGSGKSTVARLLAKLYKPTSGEIYFAGRPLSAIRSRRDVLRYRGEVPMVFQDPFASINPVFRVSHGMMRCLRLHRPELSAHQRHEEAERVFEAVGLTPPAEVLQRFPHELSGGQRQRVGFAQALALRPKLILADEPVSMLDVSIRIGLLNLMARLRDEQGVSILYITHDIASARYVADRLIIMYAARIAEQGPTEDVLASPKHPYTQLLLSAVPDPRAPLGVGAETDRGEPPRVIDPVPGCRFRWRCPLAVEECQTVTPELTELAPDHDAACHVARRGAEVRAFE
ncbi:MAG TPA: ABC transporter ATP-binding protein [Streptosporangiaceae bacterium]|nr:ABC transporter ATP-binding protein [Streptosporangiaceae bacterium]